MSIFVNSVGHTHELYVWQDQVELQLYTFKMIKINNRYVTVVFNKEEIYTHPQDTIHIFEMKNCHLGHKFTSSFWALSLNQRLFAFLRRVLLLGTWQERKEYKHNKLDEW